MYVFGNNGSDDARGVAIPVGAVVSSETCVPRIKVHTGEYA